MVDATTRDKKRTGDEVPFVLLDAPGAPTPGQTVERSAVRAAVSELQAAG